LFCNNNNNNNDDDDDDNNNNNNTHKGKIANNVFWKYMHYRLEYTFLLEFFSDTSSYGLLSWWFLHASKSEKSASEDGTYLG